MHEDPAAVITVTTEERCAVEERRAVEAVLRQRDLPPRLRERLEMVKAAALGQDVVAIARWSGRTPETVQRWLVAFRQGGIAALADAPRQGRPPKADAAYLAALEQAVETPPRTLGLSCDVWTSARLSAYLTQQTGTRIAPGWLRVLLHRQAFACGRAKHTLTHLQDPTEVAACEAALQAAGGKGAGGAGAVRTALRG
jgi:transposase